MSTKRTGKLADAISSASYLLTPFIRLFSNRADGPTTTPLAYPALRESV